MFGKKQVCGMISECEKALFSITTNFFNQEKQKNLQFYIGIRNTSMEERRFLKMLNETQISGMTSECKKTFFSITTMNFNQRFSKNPNFYIGVGLNHK